MNRRRRPLIVGFAEHQGRPKRPRHRQSRIVIRLSIVEMEVTKIDRIALRQLCKGNALAIAMTESVRFKGKLAAKNGRYEIISIPSISLTSVTCKYYNL